MAIMNGNGADAPDATGTHGAPPSDPPAGSPPSAPPPPAATVEVAAPSKHDWAGLAQSMRSIADALAKGAAPAAPAKQPAQSADVAALATELAAMKRHLALEQAFGAHGVAATSPLRDLISIAAAAANPPDLSAFVAQYARLGNSTPAAPAAPVTPPIAPTNTGAPQAGPSATSTRTDNPRHWPPEKVNAMSVEEFRAEMAAYDARNGVGNPFRGMRQQLDKRLDPLRKR